MIYTQLTTNAMKIAFEAHRDQTDISGVPYIYHPIHLAEQCDNEYDICVALLHDVMEDCDEQYKDKIYEEFPQEVIKALELLNHKKKKLPYMEYIKEIKKDIIATKIKILDLKHNLDSSRITNVEVYDEKKKEKLLKKRELYKQALEFLMK